MSGRIDKTWVVFDSVENDEHDRCVDLFRRPDGSFGFEAFRRDVEDAGRCIIPALPTARRKKRSRRRPSPWSGSMRR
jgi:hypothetical protein